MLFPSELLRLMKFQKHVKEVRASSFSPSYYRVPNRQSDLNSHTDLQNPLKLISAQTRISAQGCKKDLNEINEKGLITKLYFR